MVKLIAWLTNIVILLQSVSGANVRDMLSNLPDEYLDVSYGKSITQKVDIYVPFEQKSGAGLILYIHGGSWDHGSKEVFANKCKKYSAKGYVTATMNYRLVNQGASARDMMNDISYAMKKIKTTVAKKNVTINKVMIVGISAGAHLALLYSYTRADTSPIKIAAVTAYCPPSDLYDDKMYTDTGIGSCNQMVKTMSVLCGETFTYKTKSSSEKALKAISPYYNVTSSSVPTLFCHGKFDGAVPYAQSVRLKMKLDSYEVPNNFVIFPNSAHSLDKDPDKMSQFTKLFEEYLFIYMS